VKAPYGLKENVGGRRLHRHRAIAERVVGRVLSSKVQVHHVDGNKRNFANTNLVICENAAYHQLLHLRTLALRAGADPNTHRLCSRCRTPKPFADFYQRADRPGGLGPWCKGCYATKYQAQRGPRRVSRLYKFVDPDVQARVWTLLRSGLSQRQVGRICGVSQGAISNFVRRSRAKGEGDAVHGR
jgi:hypothetical protein